MARQLLWVIVLLLPVCYPHTDAFVTNSHHKFQQRNYPRQCEVVCRKSRELNAGDEAISSPNSQFLLEDETNSVIIAKLRLRIQEAVSLEDFVAATKYQTQLKNLQRKSSQFISEHPTGALILKETSLPARLEAVPRRSLVIPDDERIRVDETDDALFYAKPRMALHTDMQYAVRLQKLYDSRLRTASSILDLGASCATFLPEHGIYQRVVGLGMNMEEMLANEDLSQRIVHDLNACSTLPFMDSEFDAVLCASTLHYLREPETILAEVRRVLKPGGVLVVSFSDRLFERKAIEAWKRRGNIARCDLVADCLAAAGGMTPPERVLDLSPLAPLSHVVQQLRPLCGGDPFMALVSYKGAPPPGWAVRLHGPPPLHVPWLKMTVPPMHLTPFAAVYLLYTLLHAL